MRFVRPILALFVAALMATLVATGEPPARAQSTEDAEEEAGDARERVFAASGLVDEAVENRDEIERQLADSITRLNDLAAQLSQVGADIDRIASQVGYADVELAGIQAAIESQAVDAYMIVVASPSVSLVNSANVERALVAGSVVEDVVADGRSSVSDLLSKRDDLESLKEKFLADEMAYQELQQAVDDEVAHYTELFEQADAQLANAIREAEAADRAHRAALGAVEVAREKEAERERQEHRSSIQRPTTTASPTSTAQPSPTTTAEPTSTTGASKSTSTTSGGGGGGPYDHPPQVEQWRSMAQRFFPSSRVEEALRIIDCESNGDTEAVNPYTGAAGLFQFLPSTWTSASPQAGYGGHSALDPEASIATAAWLANHYLDLGYDYWHAWNCRRML